MNENNTRRAFLTLTGASITGGLAGCTGSPESSSQSHTTDSSTTNTTTTAPSGSSIIESAAFSGMKLVVSLTSTSVADKINLVSSKGEVLTSEAVGAGATRVSFEFSGTITRTLSIVAVKSDEVVEEIERTFSPRPIVKTVRSRAVEKQSKGEDASTRDLMTGLVDISNEGNGPLTVVWAGLTEKVPDPTELPDKSTLSDGTYGLTGVEIPPNTTKTVELERTPFKFSDHSPVTTDCESPKKVEATLTFFDSQKTKYTDEVPLTYSGGKIDTPYANYFCKRVASAESAK